MERGNAPGIEQERPQPELEKLRQRVQELQLAQMQLTMAKAELEESERRYRELFEHAPASLWEEDFSGVKSFLEELRRQGVTDFRAYFDAHPEAVAECTRRIRLLSVNRTTLELYGAHSIDELRGHQDRIFIPESLELLKEELVALAGGATVFDGAGINGTLRGEVIHIALRLIILPGYEATWKRVLVAILDLTPYYHLQWALQDSEQRFRTLVESMDDIVFTLDRQQRHTGVYGRWLKRWGLTPEMFLGKTAREFFGTEEAARPHEEANARALAGEYVIYEWSTTDSAGTHYFQTSLSPMLDEAGQVVGLVGIGRDITELKRMEQALARSEALLRAIFDNIQEGIVVTDLEGRILEINPVALQMAAPLTREAVLGKSFAELLPLPSELIRTESEKIRQALIEGKSFTAERFIPGPDGQERIRLSHYFPLRDAGGQVVGVINIIRDVTEERRMEEERRRLDKLEALGLLAGGIAHDFNNLLTAVLGNISLARLHLPADHEVQKLLAEAERASLRTRDLTQQLLTFAKGGEPIRELATISDLLHDITRFILRGSSVRPAITIAPDLWPVEVDKGQFGQVVQNIVLNARQAMPAGGTLYLTAENVTIAPPGQGIVPPGAYVRITFRDEGIGIPKEHLSRVFDPYFTTKQEGSGLGLAVVHSIVRRHGGYITVDSVLGQGATFTIYLPAQPERRAPRETPRPAVAAPEKYAGRILIMDDETMVRELLRRYLSHLGFECDEAGDGRHMLEKYQEARRAGRPFDLVIMDLTIPGGMGGKEAIVRLRQLDPTARAIVVSGYANDPIMARYAEYGFNGVVSKPFNLEGLKAVLLKVLETGGERAPAPAEAAPAQESDAQCESDPRQFIYRIDAGDILTAANDAWDEFAIENEAPYLTRQNVIGRSLWEFIAGQETQHLYRVLFQRVRDARRSIAIPFRCDAPDCRRYMEMQMTPDDAGGITFTNRILRLEKRPPVRLLAQSAPRSPDFVTMCGWCKKVRLSDGRWAEVEEAIRVLHLFDERIVPQISHGICPECQDRVLGVWGERRAG